MELTALIALMPQIIAGVKEVGIGIQYAIQWIMGIRAAAQQTKEWTPELDEAFIQLLFTQATSPEQKTDAQIEADAQAAALKVLATAKKVAKDLASPPASP